MTEDNGNDDYFDITVTNTKLYGPQPWKGNIRVYKEVVDEKDENPSLAGFLIELWQGDLMIDSDETDEDGLVVFRDLAAGTYTIKENLGELEDEYEVAIENNGVVVLMEDNENDDYFELTVTNTKVYEPEPWKGNIRVYKEVVDEKDENPSLEGFLIELWQGDLMIDSGETDEYGEVEFTGLEEGTYIIKENLGELKDDYDVDIENNGVVLVKEDNENDDYFEIRVTNTKEYEPDNPPSDRSRYGLSIDKKADVDEYSAVGDEIVYTIILRNTGNRALRGVEVSDPMLEDLAGPAGDVDSDGLLDVNETWVYTGTYTVTEEDMQKDSLTNTAVADSDNTGSVRDSVTVNKVEEDIPDIEPPLGPPEVPEDIEEPEVPLALPDTGSVFNSTIIAALGLLLIIAGVFISKFKFI